MTNNFLYLFTVVNNAIISINEYGNFPVEELYAMVKIKPGVYIRAEKGYKQRKKEISYNIAVSPFPFKDNYDDVPDVDYNKFSPDCIVLNTKTFANLSRDLPKRVLQIAIQIMYLLQPNTNIVKITQEISAGFYSKANKPSTMWYNVVRILEEYKFFKKTSQQSTYVINHNIIFKGNLNEFARKYKEAYGDAKGFEDRRGNLIIDKANKNRIENTEEAVEKIKELNSRIKIAKNDSDKFGFSIIIK